VSERKSVLMIPGPTEIPWRVIRAMIRPSVAHYDPEFNIDVLDGTLQRLKEIFQTRNEVIAMPGSGRVALEASIASVIEPDDKVLCIEAGTFGPWMTEMVKRVGGHATTFSVEWGKPIDLEKLENLLSKGEFKALTIVHNETSTGSTYPIDRIGEFTRKYGVLYFVDTVSSLGGVDVKTDEYHIDFNMTASHKCLAAPIGLSMVSISDNGWKAMESRKKPAATFSYDLLRWKKWWLPKERGGDLLMEWRRQPITMPVHTVYALEEATKMILEEGLDNRFKRHRIAARAVREGIKALGLVLFPDSRVLSDTVTAVRSPENISDSLLRSKVWERYGIMISGGLERQRGKMLRIGHMGMTASAAYILPLFSAIEFSLAELAYRFERGAGVETARGILEEIPFAARVSPL